MRGTGAAAAAHRLLALDVTMRRDEPVQREVWWLTSEQYCEHCLQGHAVGVEVRCVSCEETCCPECAITVVSTRTVLCPACARKQSASRRRR